MEGQEQMRNAPRKSRYKFFRLFVFYPLAWIIVSVILFYLVKK